MNLAAFKAYDVRGRIPDEINEDLARQIGRAYASFVKPHRVVVGRDIRLTSAALAEALIEGLLESGVSVADIGLCGTEGVYFATAKSTSSGNSPVRCHSASLPRCWAFPSKTFRSSKRGVMPSSSRSYMARD